MTQKKLNLKKIIPLSLLLIGFALFFAFDLHQYFTMEKLRENRGLLKGFVDEWGLLALMLFMGIYVVMTSLSVPGGSIMTITGGFLFGTIQGTLATVLGASIGASIVFTFVKLGLGENLAKNAGKFMEKMRQGFEKGAISYMLVLRLLPVFPFWLVNIVPALMNISLGKFFLTTFLGIIPGTYVYSSIGNGLDSVFKSGEDPDLGIIFTPEILTPIIGLAALSILPIFKDKILGFFDKSKAEKD